MGVYGEKNLWKSVTKQATIKKKTLWKSWTQLIRFHFVALSDRRFFAKNKGAEVQSEKVLNEYIFCRLLYFGKHCGAGSFCEHLTYVKPIRDGPYVWILIWM
jgi:hypothetical protein